MERTVICTKYIGVTEVCRKTDIGTKNVSEPDLTPRTKYIMVRLEN